MRHWSHICDFTYVSLFVHCDADGYSLHTMQCTLEMEELLIAKNKKNTLFYINNTFTTSHNKKFNVLNVKLPCSCILNLAGLASVGTCLAAFLFFVWICEVY